MWPQEHTFASDRYAILRSSTASSTPGIMLPPNRAMGDGTGKVRAMRNAPLKIVVCLREYFNYGISIVEVLFKLNQV